MPPALFSEFIGSAADTTLLLAVLIVVAAMFFEDAAIVIAGVLAADGTIPILLALPCLYLGVVLADLAYYLIGSLARTHPRLDKHVDHAFIAPIKKLIERRYLLTVFIARFIPGTRLATYVASGFFRAPFVPFLLVDVVAVLLWTSFLFLLAYWYGSTSSWLGPARYGIALLVLLVFFIVGRHNYRAFRKAQQQQNEQA